LYLASICKNFVICIGDLPKWLFFEDPAKLLQARPAIKRVEAAKTRRWPFREGKRYFDCGCELSPEFWAPLIYLPVVPMKIPWPITGWNI
jgi:hypothetical protein